MYHAADLKDRKIASSRRTKAGSQPKIASGGATQVTRTRDLRTTTGTTINKLRTGTVAIKRWSPAAAQEAFGGCLPLLVSIAALASDIDYFFLAGWIILEATV